MSKCLLIFAALIVAKTSLSQKIVQFRTSIVYSDVDDMDGFGSGDSDPQWDYEIIDLTFGTSDDGSTELGNTNCPGTLSLNDPFYSESFDCELPSSYRFIWSGFEDDAIGTDANTGDQIVNFSGLSINPNQTTWTNAIAYQTAFASGDPCGVGGTVTWRIQLQYRVLGSSLCHDECIDPYVLPTVQEYVCGPVQTSTTLNIPINATEPADASEPGHASDPLIIAECGAGIVQGSSPEDVWVQTTIPPNTGGVTIQFENLGGCTGFACFTNVSYAWYTSSDGTCNGLEYRGCGAVSCFLGCNDGEIQVDGIAGQDVWVRIWEEDDQGHNIVINQITPTAPADHCYTALPLGATGCNYQATSPTSGAYAEPDNSSWTSGAHPGGCQDGDSDPATNTIWASNENMVWYSYTHSGGDFNLAIDNMSCTGGAATAQVGIFTNSGTPDNVTCDLATETGWGCSVGQGAVQLSVASLPVGNYIVVVDGNAGAECDWIFTDFVGNTPLPIELFQFDAELINVDEVLISWLTGSEKDNDYFTIERSQNGQDWEEIKYVQGAGNSSQVIQYQDWDLRPFYGVSYYRLKQTDFNGEYTYSAVKAINNKTLFDISVYPNPASDQITIEFGEEEQTSFSIRNSIGTEIPVDIQYLNGKAVVNLRGFSSGLYFVIIERDGVLQQEKFVVKAMN